MFKEHETCETPDTCKFGELCQRALVIKQEIKNEIDLSSSDLKVVVDEATCEHPDVQEAKRAAQKLIPKQTSK